MASSVSRGAAAKGKTKKWLEARGYQVADLEIVRYIYTPRGRMPIKRDQFASDLLAVGRGQIVFVQVKSGAQCKGGTFPAARREFGKFTFPDTARTIIIAWPPLARVPRLVECFTDETFVEVEASIAIAGA